MRGYFFIGQTPPSLRPPPPPVGHPRQSKKRPWLFSGSCQDNMIIAIIFTIGIVHKVEQGDDFADETGDEVDDDDGGVEF